MAAGPVGRHASAGTDWKMNTEMLTYSRSKGVFAGLTLEGAVVEQDNDSTRAIYGKHMIVSQYPFGQGIDPEKCGRVHESSGRSRPPGSHCGSERRQEITLGASLILAETTSGLGQIYPRRDGSQAGSRLCFVFSDCRQVRPDQSLRTFPDICIAFNLGVGLRRRHGHTRDIVRSCKSSLCSRTENFR